MDSVDYQILELLRDNSEITAASVSETVHLSVPAVNKRMLKLKASGIISKFTVLLDHKAIGKPITAFVLVSLKDFDDTPRFLKAVADDPDILECYAVSGDYDELLKISAKNIDDLESKILFLKQNGVQKTQTLMGLHEYKHEATALPHISNILE